MVFIDTSALFALNDKADQAHQEALSIFSGVLSSAEIVYTHNYIIVETAALLQRRLGSSVAVKFLREIHDLAHIVWIDSSLHASTVENFCLNKMVSRRGVSFVDQASFSVMRHLGIKKAFAFDEDFKKEGFEICEAADYSC